MAARSSLAGTAASVAIHAHSVLVAAGTVSGRRAPAACASVERRGFERARRGGRGLGPHDDRRVVAGELVAQPAAGGVCCRVRRRRGSGGPSRCGGPAHRRAPPRVRAASRRSRDRAPDRRSRTAAAATRREPGRASRWARRPPRRTPSIAARRPAARACSPGRAASDVDPATHERAGDVERLGRDVGGWPVGGVARDGDEPPQVGTVGRAELRRDRGVGAELGQPGDDRGVHLGHDRV